MVDEAAVLVLNHQAGANTHQSELQSRIPNPESRIQKQEKKRGGGGTFLASYKRNLTKLKFILFLNRHWHSKFFEGKGQRITVLITKKIVT